MMPEHGFRVVENRFRNDEHFRGKIGVKSRGRRIMG
jgi:hypothetical protein